MKASERIFGYSLLFAAIALALLSSCSMAAKLTVNNTLWEMDQKNGNTTAQVYEISDGEGREDALHYIERGRDKFHPGQELIDAAKADDSKLKERLKGGFVLFTTLNEESKLFKAATQPLNIQIEKNTLHWGDLTVPITEDLRIMLVGKNPYGDGYCVVFAAGSNRLLVGINSIWASCDRSYGIYQGEKLLKQGDYRKNFAAYRDRIPQAEAVADVNQFFSTLQRVHPDLLAKVDVKAYSKLKQQTLDDIAKNLDSEGKINVQELAYSLYYAAAFFKDGHTSLHWYLRPDESSASGKRFPPFLLGYDNGRFVVTVSSNKNIDGLEVLSINGKPVMEFLSPILDRCSGETLAFKADRFNNQQPFWYCLSNLCGSAQSLALELRDAKGKMSEQVVETVSLADFQKINSEMPASKLLELRRQGAQVHFLDSDRIAYFVYPAFKFSEDEKKKVGDVFKQIKVKSSQDLIIDLRGNSGGNSSMGDFIFSYLYDGKFTGFSKIRVKWSRDVLSTVAKDWGIPADYENLLVTNTGKEESVPKPNAFFSGRAFLLTDNGTFSSAADFTAMFRDYNVGRILGYETGGLPNCFGDVYSFELDNSAIPCGVSWKQFFGPKPRPGDDEHGVIPDVAMNDKLLKTYQKEEDPVLAFTLDHIKKARGK